MATYLDADGKSSTDYTNVKAVLDDALNGYVKAKGHMERPNVRYGKHVFKHQTKFPCVKKPPSSTKDAYYALYHMNKFIRDQQQLTLPKHLRDWPTNWRGSLTTASSKTSSASKQSFVKSSIKMSLEARGSSTPAISHMTWYVVYKGKVPGVYNDWEECRRQVHRFSGNSYKGNPSKEIFSELDETFAQGPIFARSFQKTEEITKWGHDLPPGPLVWPPALTFRLLKASVAKPPVPRATIRKTFRDAAAVPSRGFRRSPPHLPERDSSPGGLYTAMVASGVMSE
ncbi:hypothetical protein QYE76_049418 [Lolium multiflorum]|uniref:Ribonuclease H1 N-terminal domain-containing protein n=1 Tax=Lolium multiflorum TaxID=4521 RepID=A0AAD8SPA6_LOLMU|nr:hypothetical protein QYE76_049418 [Lolium multiflorum]